MFSSVSCKKLAAQFFREAKIECRGIVEVPSREQIIRTCSERESDYVRTNSSESWKFWWNLETMYLLLG